MDAKSNLFIKGEKIPASEIINELMRNLELRFINIGHVFKNEEINLETASLVWNDKNYNAFLELLMLNSKYPQNFLKDFLEKSCKNEKMKNIFEMIAEINEIHKTTKDDEIFDGVKRTISKYPTLKYFYNTENESLLQCLMKREQFEICDRLNRELGLELGPEQKYSENNKTNKIRKNIRMKCLTNDVKVNILDFEVNYIKILEANAHFIASEEHPNVLKSTYFKIIQNILRVLDLVPLNVKFLKLLAAYNHKKVIYDFSNTRQKPCVDNKKYLNRNEVIFCCQDFLKFPLEMLTGDKSYEDYVKSKKQIQPPQLFAKIARPPRSVYFDDIGSHNEEIPLEQIPKKEKLSACFASVAHELAHWALQLTYENHCKPYSVEDEERKEIYEDVLRKTNFDEETLKVLEKSDDKFYQAENVVRIPQLLTFYHGNTQEILKLKRNFLVLFDFINIHILPDVEKASRNIFGIKKVEEINLHCGVEEIVQEENFRIKNEVINFDLKPTKSKILLITSNCPILALTSLKQLHFTFEESRKFKNRTMTNLINGRIDDELIFFIFARQNQIFIKDFREPILEAFNSCQNSVLIIYCKPDVKFITLIEILQKLNTFNRVIFVANEVKEQKLPENFEKLILNFNWNSLEDYTKERILKQKISFQGRKIEVVEILSESDCDEIFEYLILERSLDIKKPSYILDLKPISNFVTLKEKKSKESLTGSNPEKIEVKIYPKTYKEIIKNIEGMSGLVEVFLNEQKSGGSTGSIENSEDQARITQVRITGAKLGITQDNSRTSKVLATDVQSRTAKIETRTYKNQSRIYQDQSRTLEILSIESLIDEAKDENIILISGPAGSGKSTLLHKIANFLKHQDPSNLILIVDLVKDVRKSSIEKLFEQKLSENAFKNFITKKIFNFDNYERRIFDLLLRKGKVKIFFDDFEAISLDFRLKFLDNLQNLKVGQFWIATRRNVEKVRTFNIVPLNNDQITEFLTKRNSNRTFKKIKSNFENLHEIGDFLKLILLIEIENLNGNFSTFDAFEKVFEARHRRINSHYSFNDFMIMHEKMAIELIFDGKFSEISSYEKISKFGIAKIDKKSKSGKFYHESFGEFLIARFVVRKIEKEIDEKYLNIFMKVFVEEKFELVRKLMEMRLRRGSSFEKKIEIPMRFLDVRNVKEPPQDIVEPQASTSRGEPSNTSEEILSKNSKISVSYELKKGFLNEILRLENSTKIIKNLENLPNLLEIIYKITKKDVTVMHKMLITENSNSIILDIINQENFEILWKFSNKFNESFLREILNESHKNILSVIAQKSIKFKEDENSLNLSLLEFDFEKNLKSKFSFEPQNSTSKLNPMAEPFVMKWASYAPSKESTINPQETPKINLQFPQESQMSRNFEAPKINLHLSKIIYKVRNLFTTEEFIKFLLIKDREEKSILHHAVVNNMENLLFLYFEELERYLTNEELKEFLKEENILIFASNLDILKFLLKRIEILFNREEILEVLNIKFVTTENLLFSAVKRGDSKIFRFLFEYYSYHGFIDMKVHAKCFIYALIDAEVSNEIFKDVRKILNETILIKDLSEEILKPLNVIDKSGLKIEKLSKVLNELNK